MYYEDLSPEKQAEVDHMYDVVEACSTLEDFRACGLLTERPDDFVLANRDRMYFAVVQCDDGDFRAFATMSVVAHDGKVWFLVHEDEGPVSYGAAPGFIRFFSVKRLDESIERGDRKIWYNPLEDRAEPVH